MGVGALKKNSFLIFAPPPTLKGTSALAPSTNYCYGPLRWRINEMFRTAAPCTPCPLRPGSTACAYHILTECTHSPVVAARLTLSIAAAAYLPTLSKHIVEPTVTTSPLPVQVAHTFMLRTPTSPPD